MAHHAWNPECKVYVGGLSEDANRYDLEDAFGKIGKVKSEPMKPSVMQCFGSVSFQCGSASGIMDPT